MANIDLHKYTTAAAFLDDIFLICSNALEYNPDRGPTGIFTLPVISFSHVCHFFFCLSVVVAVTAAAVDAIMQILPVHPASTAHRQ